MDKTIDQLIQERRSIRKYKPDVPSNAMIEEIIQCAIMAPSPSNSQPVRFFRITSTAITARLRQALDKGYNDLLDAIQHHAKFKKLKNRLNYYRRFSEFMFDAPVLFAMGTLTDVTGFAGMLVNEGVLAGDMRGYTDADITTGLALKGFLLKAQSLGLGTCILTAPMLLLPDMAATLGLERNVRVTCFVTLGYADEAPVPTSRKKIDDVYQEI